MWSLAPLFAVPVNAVLCSNRRTDSTLNPRVASNAASCWSHESYHLRIALAGRISKCRNRPHAPFGASVPPGGVVSEAIYSRVAPRSKPDDGEFACAIRVQPGGG